MKPNFALGLTDDGITLWQRDSSGWLRVGAVSTDAADMDAELQGLVKVAHALAPEGVLTKLVVPDEQILFCELPVTARNRDMQGHEIRAQLSGRTPYPVEELDFDWIVTDGTAEVAVVARETLVEAEDFARSIGLNPVCSVAAPASSGFAREPFFALARGLRDILDDPSALERDDDILRETGIAVLPDPELLEPVAPAQDKVSTTAPADTEPEAPDLADVTTPKAKAEPAEPENTPEKTAEKQPEAAQSKARDAHQDAKTPPDAEPKRKRKRKASASAKTSPSDAEAPQDADKPAPAAAETGPLASKAQDATQPASTKPARIEPERTEPASTEPVASAGPDAPATAGKSALLAKLQAAKSVSLADETEPAAAPDKTSALDRVKQKFTSAVAAKPPTPDAGSGSSVHSEAETSDSVSFRSRRGAPSAAGTAPKAAAKPEARTTAPAGGLRTKLSDMQSLSRLGLGGLGRVIGKGSATTAAAESQSAPEAPGKGSGKGSGKGFGKTVSAKTAVTAGTTRKKTTSAGESPYPISISPQKPADARRKPLETLQARSGDKTASDETERMTIFGARNHTELGSSTPRRALLVLGGVGLILLAAAIWVSFFTATAPDSPELAEDSAIIETPAPLLSEQTETAVLDAAGADDIESALGLEDAAQQLPVDAPEPESTAQAEPAQPESERPVTETPSAPGRIAGLRSSALLPPQDAAPLPEAPAAPAPFGTDPLPPSRSEVAAEERLAQEAQDPQDPPADVTSADGPASVLPEGEDLLEIEVASGTPPAIPPARPEALAPEPEIEAQPDIETPTEAEVQPEIETGLAASPEADPESAEAALADPETGDESGLVIDVTQGRPAAVPPGRPEGLAPEPPATEATGEETGVTSPPDPDSLPETSADQASLDAPPPGGVALTALRPQTRPEALVERIAEADTGADAEPPMSDSQFAVATSLRPGARPGQFSAVVQRALRAAQPRSSGQPPATVAAAPVQTASAAAAAPQIPTSASVAREATQTRAINLRQVNLIGVMGTPSSRRALVRLSNGRVVTVRVGDSLDNGRVTAIGENELRYSRRGRDVVLRIAS